VVYPLLSGVTTPRANPPTFDRTAQMRFNHRVAVGGEMLGLHRDVSVRVAAMIL
jgi:hypothetical protein